jgi:hypothetical protein
MGSTYGNGGNGRKVKSYGIYFTCQVSGHQPATQTRQTRTSAPRRRGRSVGWRGLVIRAAAAVSGLSQPRHRTRNRQSCSGSQGQSLPAHSLLENSSRTAGSGKVHQLFSVRKDSTVPVTTRTNDFLAKNRKKEG